MRLEPALGPVCAGGSPHRGRTRTGSRAALRAHSAARSGEMAAHMSEQGSHDKILIVDFGSQVTQLIARRVREEGVYSEIVPFQKAAEAFAAMKPTAVILSGGPASVLDKDAPLAPKALFEAGVPVLGICYGEQAMAHQLGGEVEAVHHREFGRAEVEVTEDTPLFDGVWRPGEKHPVWMSHGDRVTGCRPAFASSAPRAMRRSR